MINKDTLKEIIHEASLAPSAHNTQPVRVHVNKDHTPLALKIDANRELPIADPKNKDAFISMGCFVEGLNLSLQKRSFEMENIKFTPEQGVFSFSLKKREKPVLSDLQNFIYTRYCHRAHFRKLTNENLKSLADFYQQQENCLWVASSETIKELAHDYDEAAWNYLKQDDYYDELYRWCRLNQNHPNYYVDGLNLDSMGLQAWEKPFAKVIMKPKVLSVMKKMRIARPLMSEADKIKSAAGMLVLLGKKDDSPINWGRDFYRHWLNLCKFQAVGSPLSSLVDYERLIDKWQQKLEVPTDFKIINILRVGGFLEKDRPQRCRLDTDKILLEDL